MPRQIRIEYPGAIYHVRSRGDRRAAIVLDESDRELWIRTSGEACGKCDWQIHACLLDDKSFHLVVETPEANLVSAMKLLGTYSVQFKVPTRPEEREFEQSRGATGYGHMGKYFQSSPRGQESTILRTDPLFPLRKRADALSIR